MVTVIALNAKSRVKESNQKRQKDGVKIGRFCCYDGSVQFRTAWPYYFPFFVHGLLYLTLLLPNTSTAYYVGPEVGKAPGETRLVKTTRSIFGFPNNATSLAEAAYVPYIYSIGNNFVTFLRSVIPGLQPKVDFLAEQIQDTIDITNTKLMQKLENSNNGILAVENFFTGLMKAVVLGKGPEEEEERRRRLAIALIRSGMVKLPTTTSTTTSTTTTTRPTVTTKTNVVTLKRPTGSTPSPVVTTASTRALPETTTHISPEDITSTYSTASPPTQKARDNDFTKMKVINIVKNLL